MLVLAVLVAGCGDLRKGGLEDAGRSGQSDAALQDGPPAPPQGTGGAGGVLGGGGGTGGPPGTGGSASGGPGSPPDGPVVESDGPGAAPADADNSGAPDTGGSSPPTSCVPSMRRCDDGCFPRTDPKHCGDSCAPCREPAGGTATCDGTACALSCNAGYLHCSPGKAGETCTARVRGFESGTNEGFYLFNATTGQSDYVTVLVSSTQAHSGSRSLAFRMRETASFSFGLRLCDDANNRQGVDLRGRTLTFWYYLDTPSTPADYAHIWARVGSTSDVYDDVTTPRTWTRVSIRLGNDADNNTDFISLDFNGGRTLAEAASATYYLDDVSIE